MLLQCQKNRKKHLKRFEKLVVGFLNFEILRKCSSKIEGQSSSKLDDTFDEFWPTTVDRRNERIFQKMPLILVHNLN